MVLGSPEKELAMRARLLLFVVAAFVVIANAGPSTATPIIVGYSGVIDTVDDPFGLIPGVVPGTTFSGTYTLDPDLFTVAIPGSSPGIFLHGFGPGSVEVDIGGNLFSRVVGFVMIGDAIPAPSGGVEDLWAIPIFLPAPTPEFTLIYRDSTLTRITDPTSFFVNTSLDGWDLSEMLLRVDDPTAPFGTRTLTRGTITEVFVIPEPSTALLVGLGLIALGSRRRA